MGAYSWKDTSLIVIVPNTPHASEMQKFSVIYQSNGTHLLTRNTFHLGASSNTSSNTTPTEGSSTLEEGAPLSDKITIDEHKLVDNLAQLTKMAEISHQKPHNKLIKVF